MTTRTLRAIFAALEARVEFDVRWRGGALDCLLDERHAVLVNLIVAKLGVLGWETAVETSFSHYGNRGSIDVLAWHPRLGTLLVVEVKTEITSIEELARRLDVKSRLARQIAIDGRGWHPQRVATVLILPETTASRTSIRRFAAVFRSSFPARGREIRNWLREPDRALQGVWFLSPTTGSGGTWKSRSGNRVRLPAKGRNRPQVPLPTLREGSRRPNEAGAELDEIPIPRTTTASGMR